MSKNNRSFYLYFVIIIGLLLFTVWIGTLKVKGSGYTRGEFEVQLQNGEVAMVNICPNKETPTGSLEITLKSGEEKTLYVTDVTEMEQLIIEALIETIESFNITGGTLHGFVIFIKFMS